MNNDRSNFKLTEWQNLWYPIASRKKGNTMIDECPYCGQKHNHGVGEGHRDAHCKDKKYLEKININGHVITQDRGYFIEEY